MLFIGGDDDDDDDEHDTSPRLAPKRSKATDTSKPTRAKTVGFFCLLIERNDALTKKTKNCSVEDERILLTRQQHA
jgi:hypothetical protein